MKQFIGIGFLIFITVTGWKLGEHMSSDAVGMALGVIFGLIAGIPAALIALVANNQQVTNHYYITEAEQPAAVAPVALLPQTQKPVIILPSQPQKRIEVER